MYEWIHHCCNGYPFLITQPAVSAEHPWQAKLPFKEATITYEIQGLQQGTETLYIKDFGAARAKKTSVILKAGGKEIPLNRLEISDKDWVIQYNPAEKTGTKTVSPYKLYQLEYAKLTPKEQQAVNKNARQYKPYPTGYPGEEKILGHACDIVTAGDKASMIHSKIYYLRGTDIPLRADFYTPSGEVRSITATRIDTTSPIPEALFTSARDITIRTDRTREAMTTQAVRQAMAVFASPEIGKTTGSESLAPALPEGIMPDLTVGDLQMSKEEQEKMIKEMIVNADKFRAEQPESK